MGLRISGFTLLSVALAIASVVLYRNSFRSEVPLVFAPTQVLGATWTRYKQTYIDQTSGRTMDPSEGGVTTSEGESYTMLRAVWMADKTTFDSSWKFTQEQLQRKDSLFSWQWGKRPDGTYGILTGGGGAASDADSDIALALIFAYARWQDPAYQESAKSIISSIWNKEVVPVRGVPYLAADDTEKADTASNVLINPSYLSPATYRLFAQIDPAHPWNQVVDSSYLLLQKSITAPLSDAKGGLVPDWLSLNRTTGALEPPKMQPQTTNYGYDALRTPWRIALDWEWNHDPRAKQVLSEMSPLADAWQKQAALDTVYTHSGAVVGAYESPAMYGGAIGYFLVTDPAAAQKVYTDKLVYLYNPDLNAWKQPLSYYDDNWAWFGIALYNNLLPNLAADLPKAAYAARY